MNEQCNGWGLVTGATEDDGTRHDTTLIAGAGGQIPVEVFRPASATGSAVVIGAEATGPNRFVRTVVLLVVSALVLKMAYELVFTS